MSDTPETNKCYARIKSDRSIPMHKEIDFLAADMRDIETQRDEARAELLSERKSVGDAATLNMRLAHEKQGAEVALIEARAEVERLRKALDAGLCSCEADYTCARCRILAVTPTETVIPVSSTQPEIFEAHGKEWYRHTPGDKMPCDANLLTDVIFQTFEKAKKLTSNWWDWENTDERNKANPIIGWRPADAPEKLERK